MYYLYIIKSRIVERFYVGVTSDLTKRLLKHNTGGNKSTKPYKPFYSETYKTKRDALIREGFLKSPKGYLEKLEILKDFKK